MLSGLRISASTKTFAIMKASMQERDPMKEVMVVRVITELLILEVIRVHMGEKPGPHEEHSKGFTRCSTPLHYTSHSHSGEEYISVVHVVRIFLSVKLGIHKRAHGERDPINVMSVVRLLSGFNTSHSSENPHKRRTDMNKCDIDFSQKGNIHL